ncbi:GNAT family acetyltransferase [Pseudomonas sp. ODNR1LW]|nr:GNAT family acetyltransferase [Pseudomonas sp. ODNR1LW]
MSYVTRAVFALVSLILTAVAILLVGLGLGDAWKAIQGPDSSASEAMLDVLGYVIVAIAVFDVAKYLFEEEVARDREKRTAAEARRSMTKFLTTIVIALFLEGLVAVFKTAREDIALMIYPCALVAVSVLVLVGLGLFQRLSAAVEEKVGDADRRAEAEDEAA